MMKKMMLILMALLLTVGALPAQETNTEFRATWVITWHLISANQTVEQGKARIRTILDNHVAANMNAVVWHVRQGGTAYYDSDYEPWGSYAGGSYPGFDPLEYAVEEAHKRGLEVHAWFNVFQASSTVSGAPAAEHPEWVCRDQDGIAMTSSRALSPGMAAVREYTRDVAMEVVNNYDVDGLHFDYVRWNEYTNSKVSQAWAKTVEEQMLPDMTPPQEVIDDLNESKAGRYLYDVEHPYSAGVPSGFSSWEEWWRWSVTEFVSMVHDSIQTVKPWVKLSAAVLGKYNWSGWQGYGSVFQDAALWFNEGHVDHLMPMHYHWTNATGFTGMLQNDTGANWKDHLTEGIAAERIYTVGPGSYVLADAGVWNNHPSIVNACRTIDYTSGFQFFSYGDWQGHSYWEPAGNSFFAKTTKIAPSIFLSQDVPAAPALAMNKISDLEYELTITPDASHDGLHWYLLYRSADGSFDKDQTTLVGRYFANEPVIHAELFDGTQTFNGQYHYAATAANRYWNESEFTAEMLTDSIPSYPPMIVSTYPAEADSLPAAWPLKLTFSKEMNTASVESAFSIEPGAGDAQFEWDAAKKYAEITFADGLEDGFEYQVTLLESATDVNDVQLDGNGDGTAGDAFIWNFRTLASDVYGPKIVNFYPENGEAAFDYDDAVNIQFDELLDIESLSEANLMFARNGSPISRDIVATVTENRTLLSVRSFSQLVSDENYSLTLTTGVTDTAGNAMDEPFTLNFKTANFHYAEKNTLDPMNESLGWWQPSGSGSTTGIIASNTVFSLVSSNYLPGSSFAEENRKSGQLTYQWDMQDSTHLCRLHNGGSPANVAFDTTWTLQAYVYGDSSLTEFSFSLYEKNASGANTEDIIEVMAWRPINWYGWRLIEWQLSDPDMVGDFLSIDQVMDGDHYKLDGILLRKTDESAESGKIFIDNLRIVKATEGQAPPNSAPEIEALPDIESPQATRVRIKVNYTDPDPTDEHVIIVEADTSGFIYRIMGHVSGSNVYIYPPDDLTGDVLMSVIVRDFGVGEMADTATFTLSITPVSIHDEALPETFSLFQNYPNPFNASTAISFTLPRQEFVNLSLFNLRGQLVHKILNQPMKAGAHTIQLNLPHLASGVYLYRLQAGEFSDMKRMMLIK
jgi:uncharacterized lipoprotein YddW (UPF0748 family)